MGPVPNVRGGAARKAASSATQGSCRLEVSPACSVFPRFKSPRLHYTCDITLDALLDALSPSDFHAVNLAAMAMQGWLLKRNREYRKANLVVRALEGQSRVALRGGPSCFAPRRPTSKAPLVPPPYRPQSIRDVTLSSRQTRSFTPQRCKTCVPAPAHAFLESATCCGAAPRRAPNSRFVAQWRGLRGRRVATHRVAPHRMLHAAGCGHETPTSTVSVAPCLPPRFGFQNATSPSSPSTALPSATSGWRRFKTRSSKRDEAARPGPQAGTSTTLGRLRGRFRQTWRS